MLKPIGKHGGNSLFFLLASTPNGVFEATGTLTPTPYQTVFDTNGDPVSGAKIYTYLAGTTTPAPTYTDVALLTPNANPIIADPAGRYVAFLSPGASYKFIIKDAADVTIRTQDNISTVPPSSSNLDITGIAGEALTAGQPVYLSNGSGGKVAGSWYQTNAINAYSSTTSVVGFVPADIANGATGTIRLSGIVTGLSSLTVGSSYYLAASAGAITLTAPTNNIRLVGVADTTSSLVLNVDPYVPPVDVGVCEGRLTLTTGVPVTRADVSAATTVFFAPYKGNRAALYDGTFWTTRTFAQLSIAVPATTDTAYDVFLYDNAGTLALELQAWNNSGFGTSARHAAGAFATDLPTQDGVPIKSTNGTAVDATRRYLGSFKTTGVSGQTEDSGGKRLLFNGYNQKARNLYKGHAATNYAYTTATFRQAAGNAANQIEVLIGIPEVTVEVSVHTDAFNGTTGTVVMVHVGEDSTTTPDTQSQAAQWQILTATQNMQILAHMIKAPTFGSHRYVSLEFSVASGTTTWAQGIGATGTPRGGMIGSMQG